MEATFMVCSCWLEHSMREIPGLSGLIPRPAGMLHMHFAPPPSFFMGKLGSGSPNYNYCMTMKDVHLHVVPLLFGTDIHYHIGSGINCQRALYSESLKVCLPVKVGTDERGALLEILFWRSLLYLNNLNSTRFSYLPNLLPKSWVH